MATYSRVHISGSTSGRPIKVGQTATPGTAIHTAVAGAVAFDEIYLYVSNISAAPVSLTLEWGGVTDPDDHIVKTLSIPAFSPPIPITSGQQLNGGLLVKAFASAANALLITGHVNRVQ